MISIWGAIFLTGILNLIKPPGMSSFDMVAWVRRLTGTKKAGHCGTLDPDAAGVLPVCIGAATGVTGFLADAVKAYRVEAVTGLLTDTLDTSGEVLERGLGGLPDRAVFEAALKSLTGEISQIPPMYSAVKVGGRKLYELARKGIEAERAPRIVEIFSIKIIYYNVDRVILDVVCSKGTYIRSLCRDLGERLGIYLCMSFLIRTESAGLRIEDATAIGTLAGLAGSGEIDKVIIPTDKMLSGYPAVDMTEPQYEKFKNGATVNLEAGACTESPSGVGEPFPDRARDGATLRVYCGGRFIGLGSLLPGYPDMCNIRLKKFLIEPHER